MLGVGLPPLAITCMGQPVVRGARATVPGEDCRLPGIESASSLIVSVGFGLAGEGVVWTAPATTRGTVSLRVKSPPLTMKPLRAAMAFGPVRLAEAALPPNAPGAATSILPFGSVIFRP